MAEQYDIQRSLAPLIPGPKLMGEVQAAPEVNLAAKIALRTCTYTDEKIGPRSGRRRPGSSPRSSTTPGWLERWRRTSTTTRASTFCRTSPGARCRSTSATCRRTFMDCRRFYRNRIMATRRRPGGIPLLWRGAAPASCWGRRPVHGAWRRGLPLGNGFLRPTGSPFSEARACWLIP